MPQGAICNISLHALSGFLVCLQLIVALLLRPTYGGQTGWLAADYPDPIAESSACGLSNNNNSSSGSGATWLCDPDRVLSQEEATQLGDFLRSLSHASLCNCEVVECPSANNITYGGYLMGIALVDRLNTDGMQFEPINVKAANFARETRNAWFTDIGCDDTALVFYSRFSNELYISLGEKMSHVVSDLELANLYGLVDQYFPPANPTTDSNGMTVTLPSGTIYSGLQVIVNGLNEAVLNGPSISSQTVFAFVIPLLLVIVIAVMCLLSNLCCSQDISVECR